MKVRVKLFGVLGQNYPGYHHEQGMDLEISDGARVKDLMAHLEISKSFARVVAVEDKLLGDHRCPSSEEIPNFFIRA